MLAENGKDLELPLREVVGRAIPEVLYEGLSLCKYYFSLSHNLLVSHNYGPLDGRRHDLNVLLGLKCLVHPEYSILIIF